MTRGQYRLRVLFFWCSLIALDRFWHASLFSFVPLLLVGPVWLTWHSRQPWLLVLLWSGLAVATTVASPFVVSGVALVPLVIRWLLPRVQVDLSLAFLAVLLISIAGQLALVFGRAAVPWTIVLTIWLLTSVVTFVALITMQQWEPHAER